MYTGKESSFRGRKIRIAGREEKQGKEENYQKMAEAKEKVIRSLKRNVSHFSHNNNMMCIYGTNSDEILKDAVEEVRHSVFCNFIMLPKTKINSTDVDDEFTLFVTVMTNFIKNTKLLGLDDYYSTWGAGRLFLFRSKINETNQPEGKGNICKNFLQSIMSDVCYGYRAMFRFIWNVEIDTDEFDHNPLENLLQIACDDLLIIVTSTKPLNFEMDLFSEDIIRTD